MEFTINWAGLGQVFIASLGFTVVIVAAFSIGIRVLTTATQVMAASKKPKPALLRKEIALRAGAYLAFTLCASAILYAIYLIVPYFHLDK